jgi:hypothetical protein
VAQAGRGNVQIIRTGNGIEVGVSNQSATASFAGTGGKIGQRAGGSGSSVNMDKIRTNVSGGKGGRFTVDAGGGEASMGNHTATGIPVRRNHSKSKSDLAAQSVNSVNNRDFF